MKLKFEKATISDITIKRLSKNPKKLEEKKRELRIHNEKVEIFKKTLPTITQEEIDYFQYNCKYHTTKCDIANKEEVRKYIAISKANDLWEEQNINW